MFYKLLGMLVWKAAKTFLRRKYGPTYAPAPLIAAVVVLVGLLIGLLFAKRDSE
jgi:hypothetical protein